MKVLVIDDDAIISEQIAHYLSQHGMSVEIELNSLKAHNAVLKHQPNIIILDEIMPNKSGMDVYSDLRSDIRTLDIPVIFISGSETKQNIYSAVEFGMLDHLRKPFRMRDLAEAILVNESIAGLNKVWNPAENCLNSLLHKYGQTA